MSTIFNFYLTKYNLANNKLLIAASYLTPSLKSFQFVGDCFNKKKPHDFQKEAIDFIKLRHNELNIKPKNNGNKSKASSNQASISNKTNAENGPTCSNKAKQPFNYKPEENNFLSFLDSTSNSIAQTNQLYSDIGKELSGYACVDGNQSISSFWLENETKFPLLSNIVKSICCATGTSTPSETEFSVAEKFLSSHRNRLKGQTLGKLTLLYRNLNIE
jgi:hypothetical protein